MLLLWWIVVAAALPGFVWLGTERFSLTARVLSWLGFSIATLPAVLMLARPDSQRNGIAAIGIVVAVTHHLAIFHERNLLLRWGEARLSESSVDLAALLAALSIPALWLGWRLAGVVGIRRWLPQLRLDVPPGPLRAAAWLLIGGALAADVLWVRGQLTTYQPAVSVISALLPLELGIAMLMMHRLAGHSSLLDRVLLMGLFAVMGLMALARGMIMVIIRPFTVFLFAWLFVARRVRLLPIVAALTAVVLMQPVKGEFRQRVWDRQSAMSIADRALLYVELIGRHWIGGELHQAGDQEQAVRTAAARMGGLLALAHVIELTPAAVPHQYGATYRHFQYAFVPRVLYPEKPISQSADVWASVMYGYTSERGTAHVMVGLPQIAEAYINFGFAGALLLLMLIGCLFRACDELVGHRNADTGALAIYLYFLLNAMSCMEGSLAQFWGGVPQMFLLYGVGMAILGLRSSRGAPMHA